MSYELTTAPQRAAVQAALGMPEGKQCLSYPDHLSRWRSKLAQAQFRQANISVYGNSLTGGYWSSNTGVDNPTAQALFRARGWVPQMRALFRSAIMPEMGEGFIPNIDARVTKSAGVQAIGSTGITAYGSGYRISGAGQTITIVTTDPCNEFWVHGWWESNAKCGSFQYSVDGGADQTATAVAALGTDVDYTFKITGLSAASHTIVIKPNLADATKQIDIAGYSAFLTAGAAMGVAVHRGGQGGGYVDTMFYPSGGAQNPRSNRLTFGRLSTDLAVFQFFSNESSTAGEGVGWSPTGQAAKNYYTYLKDVVDQSTDVYGCSALLMSLTRHQTGISSYGEQAFIDVHERIASENANCAHFDLSRIPRWASWTAANAAGLMYDSIHPNLAGHSDIGRLAYEAMYF